MIMRKDNMGKSVEIKIMRADCKDPAKIYSIEVDHNMSLKDLKEKVLKLLNIQVSDNKIVKLRNPEGILIPFTNLLEETNSNKPFIIEVTGIHQDVPVISCESSMNTVYIDTVRSKLRNMETRISRIESIIPQLTWRRQSFVEHTTCTLGNRIAFLDRRIDDLTPPQWNQQIPKSVS